MNSKKKTALRSGLIAAAILALAGGCNTPAQDTNGGSGSNGTTNSTSAATGGSATGTTPTTTSGATDDSGFTTFTASKDSLVIYVSSSQGDDANDGLSEAKPVKTVAKGLGLARTGFPDHVLFKKGDTWQGGLGQWEKSGRSQSEPMVISSYGTGDRPTFVTAPGENGIQVYGVSGTPASMDHVAFAGLRFYAASRDHSASTWQGWSTSDGIIWLRGTTDLLVEDCVFQAYAAGMVFQADPGVVMKGILAHRNLVLDSWDLSHSQSMYIDNVQGLDAEENIIVHKGFDTTVANSGPGVFSQAIYVQVNATGVTIRNNVVLNGTSHGLQLRPGGTAEGNLFAHNAIGVLLGGGDSPVPGGVTGTVKDNVILDGKDIAPDLVRGWGIDLSNIKTASVTGNIVAHAIGSDPGTPIATDPNATESNNIVNDWGKNADAPAGPFVDPNRGLESYSASVGGKGTYDDFVAQLRTQARGHWRNEYMAQAVNAYIRAGFANK